MHAEVRGRGRKWTAWIPDAGQRSHAVPLYDADGNLKEMLHVGSPPDPAGIKYVQIGGTFTSQAEAIEYLRWLDYDDVRVNRTLTKGESLEKARAARHG